jgi:hypothetical protein
MIASRQKVTIRAEGAIFFWVYLSMCSLICFVFSHKCATNVSDFHLQMPACVSSFYLQVLSSVSDFHLQMCACVSSFYLQVLR